MLKALLHPFGIMLLLASLVLAGLVLSVLDRWSGQAVWIVILGLLAYAATIAVVHRTRAVPGQPSGSESTDLNLPEGEAPEPDPNDHYNFVQEALRQLDDTAALSQSQLILLLPRTLASVCFQGRGEGTLGELTLLEKAPALREALIAAIEGLRPPGEFIGSQEPPALQYHILRLACVQRRPVADILTRLNIAEATYFRNRRAAIRTVARHLQSQEELIAAGGAKAAETG